MHTPCRSGAAAIRRRPRPATIDCGGGRSAAGNFELAGTIGQPAASPMTGGSMELVGGFWSLSSTCTCPGDMNGDGQKNGADIQQFVVCFLIASGCGRANLD